MYDLWDFYKRYGQDYEPKYSHEKTPFEAPEWINVSVPVASSFNCERTHLLSYDDFAASIDVKRGRATAAALNSSQKYCHMEIPNILRIIEGYQFITSHSRRHNILEKWANFITKDCMTPSRKQW